MNNLNAIFVKIFTQIKKHKIFLNNRERIIKNNSKHLFHRVRAFLISLTFEKKEQIIGKNKIIISTSNKAECTSQSQSTSKVSILQDLFTIDKGKELFIFYMKKLENLNSSNHIYFCFSPSMKNYENTKKLLELA
jgi:hypothetical protein